VGVSHGADTRAFFHVMRSPRLYPIRIATSVGTTIGASPGAPIGSLLGPSLGPSLPGGVDMCVGAGQGPEIERYRRATSIESAPEALRLSSSRFLGRFGALGGWWSR
jgi:hypothetical protein